MGRRAQTEEFHFEGFEYPTTTPVPDIIFDAFLSRLGEAELKALLYIVRRTFGFKKDRDAISFNQFLRGIKTREGQVLDEGCGVKDRTTLSRALQSLEAKGIIRSEKGIDARGENETTVYSLRFKGEVAAVAATPPEASEVVGNSYHPGRPVPEGVVGNSYQGGRESQGGVVGIPHHRGRENPPGVVGIAYPQQTVIQETEGQGNSNIRKSAQIFFNVDNSVDNFVATDDPFASALFLAPTDESCSPEPTLLPARFVTPLSESISDNEIVTNTIQIVASVATINSHSASVSGDGARIERRRRAIQPATAGWEAGETKPVMTENPPSPGPTHESPAVTASFSPPRQIEKARADHAVPTRLVTASPSTTRVRDGGGVVVQGGKTASLASERDAASPTDREVGYDPARDQLVRFVEDFAREFNDQAPLRSTLSRLANLYRRSALPMEAFVAHLYAARQTTQERTGAIRASAGAGSTKNKMVYFFAVLENRLGFRDHSESTDLAAMLPRSGS